MIKIQVNDEMFAYDMYHISKAFCPGIEIEQKVDKESLQVVTIIITENEGNPIQHGANAEGRILQIAADELSKIEDRKLRKRYVNLKVYDWLSEVTGKELAWGIMTGVRPTKPMMNLMEEGMTDEEVMTWMQENYHVSDEKVHLGLAVAKKEKELLEQLDYKEGYSLYVGIPFCPTTCSYCSFTSYPIAEWKERVDEYLDAVCKELTFIAEKSQNKKLNTIYIGGGTPTSVDTEYITELLKMLKKHFNISKDAEITIECNPKTAEISDFEEYLNCGINRLSIGRQTSNNKILKTLGRIHTDEDFEKCLFDAKKAGFENISADLMFALPNQTEKIWTETLLKSVN